MLPSYSGVYQTVCMGSHIGLICVFSATRSFAKTARAERDGEITQRAQRRWKLEEPWDRADKLPPERTERTSRTGLERQTLLLLRKSLSWLEWHLLRHGNQDKNRGCSFFPWILSLWRARKVLSCFFPRLSPEFCPWRAQVLLGLGYRQVECWSVGKAILGISGSTVRLAAPHSAGPSREHLGLKNPNYTRLKTECWGKSIQYADLGAGLSFSHDAGVCTEHSY